MQVRQAHGLLALVAAIWGLTFPLIRSAVSQIDAYTWSIYRFTIAVIALGCLTALRKQRIVRDYRMIKKIIPLGLLLAISYFSQAVGLETISSGRSAFITGTNVVMVPFLVWFWMRKRLSIFEWAAAVLAILGLYLMTGAQSGDLGVGEILTLVCAVTYAAYIILLERVTLEYPESLFEITFYQIAIVWICSLCMVPKIQVWVLPSWNVIFALVYCATVATVVTAWLQAKAQMFTTPQKAALLFSLEPVFAAFFGFLILREVLSVSAMIGAGLILFASILQDVWNYLRSHARRALTPL